MARRRSIDDLPSDMRRWLDRALTDGNFSGYQQLEALLREKGFVISKSAIHRYGQKIEQRLAAIRASTEAAKVLAEGTPDERDARSEALTALIQTDLFNTIVSLQEGMDGDLDPADRIKMMSNAGKNIATLTRSSVALKRYQQERDAAVEARAKEEAAKAVESVARRAGLSADLLNQLKAGVLGKAAV